MVKQRRKHFSHLLRCFFATNSRIDYRMEASWIQQQVSDRRGETVWAHLWNVPNAPAEGRIREVGNATKHFLNASLHFTQHPVAVSVCLRIYSFLCKKVLDETFVRGMGWWWWCGGSPSLAPNIQQFCLAHLCGLFGAAQENVIIRGASIRWLSFKTCMRKALQHNRSVGASLAVDVCWEEKKNWIYIELSHYSILNVCKQIRVKTLSTVLQRSVMLL